MSLINSFNTDEVFWTVNPQFKNIQPFKSLHNSDKSRNKANSSKVMWYIAQLCDPSPKNLFRNLSYDERLEVVSKDFMEDGDYFDKNKDKLEPMISTYNKLIITPAMKALQELNEKLLERAQFIRDTEYTVDSYEMDDRGKPILIRGTATQLDSMMKNTKSIYDMYHLILKSLAEEDEDAQTKGGRQLSLSDTGEI